MAVLVVVDETAEDLIDPLADLQIAVFGVSRWELTSAPAASKSRPESHVRSAPAQAGSTGGTAADAPLGRVRTAAKRPPAA